MPPPSRIDAGNVLVDPFFDPRTDGNRVPSSIMAKRPDARLIELGELALTYSLAARAVQPAQDLGPRQ